MISATKLTLPVTIIGSLLLAALGAGASWAAQSHSVSVLETRTDKIEARADKTEERVREHDIEHEGMRHDLSHLIESIDRIEHRMGTHP